MGGDVVQQGPQQQQGQQQQQQQRVSRRPEAPLWGWEGTHCEGRLFRSLFALLSWDLLFDTTVPGVFLTPYQTSPLDLHVPRGMFFANRREKAEALLRAVRGATPSELAMRVGESWNGHYGRACVGLDWGHSGGG